MREFEMVLSMIGYYLQVGGLLGIIMGSVFGLLYMERERFTAFVAMFLYILAVWPIALVQVGTLGGPHTFFKTIAPKLEQKLKSKPQ